MRKASTPMTKSIEELPGLDDGGVLRKGHIYTL